MENYISLLLATLQHLKLVTEKEAEKIDKELRNTTIPGTYSEAKTVVADIFNKVQNK
jgi:hypothetical protein